MDAHPISTDPIAFRFNLWLSCFLAAPRGPTTNGLQIEDPGRGPAIAVCCLVFGVCILDFFTPQRGGGSGPFKATATGDREMANLSTSQALDTRFTTRSPGPEGWRAATGSGVAVYLMSGVEVLPNLALFVAFQMSNSE